MYGFVRFRFTRSAVRNLPLELASVARGVLRLACSPAPGVGTSLFVVGVACILG